MTRFTTDEIFDLLPAYLRTRDAQEGQRVKGRIAPGDARAPEDFGPLRTLASLVAREAQIVDEGLDDLYDNAFIETCAPWVIPYLGDLLGVRGLQDIPEGIDMRARVADALALRARKGTLRALEHAAGTASNLPVLAVEYWKRLVHAQSMRLVHPQMGASVDMRDKPALARIGSVFERNARNVDVRRIDTAGGRFNIGNIGLHVWRLRPYSITGHRAIKSGNTRRYRFHPLGCDAQLFDRLQDRPDIDTPISETGLPVPIDRAIMAEAPGLFYGANRAMQIFIGGNPVPLEDICVADLSNDPDESNWNHAPRPDRIMIDPELGRIVLRSTDPEKVDLRVKCHFARPYDIGGGEHSTREVGSLTNAKVLRPGMGTITKQINNAGGSGTFVLEQTDRYFSGGDIQVPAGETLRIIAAKGAFPSLLAGRVLSIELGPGARVELAGLRMYRRNVQIKGEGEHVLIRDCTLVPGRSLAKDGRPTASGGVSLLVDTVGTTLEMRRCISGPIQLEREIEARFEECILDATRPDRPALIMQNGPDQQVVAFDRCTVIGQVTTAAFAGGAEQAPDGISVHDDGSDRRLATSDTLFVSTSDPAIIAAQRQVGCIRFSYVPQGSLTPRLYRCTEGPAPVFESLRYADPDYGLLAQGVGDHIRRGAENGGEIGAYNGAAHTFRNDNIRRAITDFLRFGHTAGIFNET